MLPNWRFVISLLLRGFACKFLLNPYSLAKIRFAHSRLTGLRTFFSQAALAPKKAPPPSARSLYYEQPEYPQFKQIKQPSAISIVLPHSGQVTVLTSPVGLYSSSTLVSTVSSTFSSFFLSSRFIGWN